ncbi:MAG: DNA-binding response regulator [Bacteroidetes bacterium]|nr:MAG: DNA-binding response regulator [Bacteroidota bacterium]MBL1144288.1 DNA-binding response regulator [Bacteroidota bacterium]MCB0802680.1 response regulator transcription factor [Flavobacteriales bacterium]NOG57085.1 response regulator transcription factor [Bacteroidota bacterium]
MKQIAVVDQSMIATEGLKVILNEMNPPFQVKVYENIIADQLDEFKNADLLLIDYSEVENYSKVLSNLKKQNPKLVILAITERIQRAKVIKALKFGVDSHLLKNCGKSEIHEAIYATLSGKQFFCGQVLELIAENNEKETTCEGVELTEREKDIIKLIALGYTNKQIADHLFISAHTVNTHRKNIMAKLNINNVAGLVVYAFQEDLLLSE